MPGPKYAQGFNVLKLINIYKMQVGSGFNAKLKIIYRKCMCGLLFR